MRFNKNQIKTRHLWPIRAWIKWILNILRRLLSSSWTFSTLVVILKLWNSTPNTKKVVLEFKSVIKLILLVASLLTLTVPVYYINRLIIESKNHQNLGLHQRKSLNMAEEETNLVQMHHCFNIVAIWSAAELWNTSWTLLTVNPQTIPYISTEIGITVSLFARWAHGSR